MSAKAARGEIIVISDSDVRLPPGGLARHRRRATEEPGRSGWSIASYRGRSIASLWSVLAAQDSSTRFIPSVAIGEIVGAHPCLGPTMALPAAVLDKVGGFAYLADFLADDFELGRVVRTALGYPDRLSPHRDRPCFP